MSALASIRRRRERAQRAVAQAARECLAPPEQMLVGGRCTSAVLVRRPVRCGWFKPVRREA